MTGPREPFEAHDVPSERPQVSHGYRMGHGISVAWLGEGASAAQMYALEDAWDLLVVQAPWRDWRQAYLRPTSPFLYLAVRDDLDRRRLLKTRSGVSLHLPTVELTEAEADGGLVQVFVEIIRDVYAKWADSQGFPAPPGP